MTKGACGTDGGGAALGIFRAELRHLHARCIDEASFCHLAEFIELFFKRTRKQA